METSTSVRLLDLMCPEHLKASERRWPPGLVIGVSCPPCTANLDPHYGKVRALPGLTDDLIQLQAAIHEAAHAVVGMDTGHPLVEMYVLPGGGDGKEAAGRVTWGAWSMPIYDHLAMVWAGQAACMRWLTEAGLDTEANRLDMRYLAWGDAAEADEWCSKHEFGPDWGLDLAVRLVDINWSGIVCLAEELNARHRLTGEEARDIVGF